MSAELRQTAPEYTVQYLCDGQPIVYDDFIHIMLRNSYSSFLGESLIAQNDQSVANIMAVFWLQNQLQSNGSHVDMFLTTDMSFNAEQMSRLRTSYNEQASNLGKSGGTVILSSGLKPEIVKKLPSALESDLIKSLDWTTTEISRMTGVPLTYLAMPESSNYGSAVESSRAFFITTMNPMFHKIAEEFSYKLGADIRFDTSETTMGMGQERAEILSKLLYSGTISPNEARASLGFSPVPYGDVTGMPQNTLPLDAWIDTQPNQAKQAPAEKSISNRKALESFRSLIGI
jgi:HK97 family phage portal protein